MKKFGAWLAKRKKAIAGLVAPGGALFIADVSDGNWPTQHEWSGIVLACVVGAIVVYIAPKNAEG